MRPSPWIHRWQKGREQTQRRSVIELRSSIALGGFCWGVGLGSRQWQRWSGTRVLQPICVSGGGGSDQLFF
eukprot:15061859-Alexandrium_andersonii.AAC.1